MQDENGNNRSDDDPSRNAAQNGQEGINPNKKDILIDASEIAGGIIFGGIAVALADAGFHFWGFVVGFLAVSCGLIVLAHLFEKLGVKLVKSGLVAVLILTGVLFFFLAFHKPIGEIKASPHFTFSLSTPQSDKVELTNDFLIVRDITFHKVLGVLYVPADTAQSSLTLNIWARNDSKAVAENVEIGIFVPQNWQCVPDAGWLRVEPMRPDSVGDAIETTPNTFLTN
ncbi:MAG TPA: hypothetical protein VMJ12_07455, partial [Candidatus Acidoferrales bacterium]|nr:hypothetical protein [Candidatus Acidoferrales bacterium]